MIGAPLDDRLAEDWRARVTRACAALGWPPPRTAVRRHAGGTSLAFIAPSDQLFVATEVNEWALCAALVARDFGAFGHLEASLVGAALPSSPDGADPSAHLPPVIEENAALERFRVLAAAECAPKLRALLEAADARGLQHVVDDTELSLGAGAEGRSFALATLPLVADVPWNDIHNVPTVLVTGSNGKTTTVRLLAACADAHGWPAAYNCTDGVFFAGQALDRGDYSGPVGARMVIRERRARAAVLETARGGILRRGIAVARADAAIITNVSSDHFGEYGIDDLAGLAAVKFAVAAALPPDGLLVLNADDVWLRAGVGALDQRYGVRPALGWFALDADHPHLCDGRARGLATCGIRAGRLCLTWRGSEHDLGNICDMPLTLDGLAVYNVANLAGAALAAAGIGISASVIAEVFARFGARLADNPGRLMRFTIKDVTVLVDYAHNPDGLMGFLTVARHLRGAGRLGLLLGHAGNRKDEDILELARIAASFRPDLVVVKENETQLRGRAPGEIPQMIRAELLRLGLPESALAIRGSEADAARCALDWAHPGDVLALPLHSAAARDAIVALLVADSDKRE